MIKQRIYRWSFVCIALCATEWEKKVHGNLVKCIRPMKSINKAERDKGQPKSNFILLFIIIIIRWNWWACMCCVPTYRKYIAYTRRKKRGKDTITASSQLLRSTLKETLSDSIDSRRVMRLLTDTFIFSNLSIKKNYSSEKQNLQQQQRKKVPTLSQNERTRQKKWVRWKTMNALYRMRVFTIPSKWNARICVREKKMKAKHNGQERKIKTFLQQKRKKRLRNHAVRGLERRAANATEKNNTTQTVYNSLKANAGVKRRARRDASHLYVRLV